MQKTFCDACGHEIKSRTHDFDPLIHIVDHMEGRGPGYSDLQGNDISGRHIHFDLCTGCYNAIHFEAYKVMKTIRETCQPTERG